MQYTDIVAKAYFLTSTNSTSFPIAQVTVEANNALERVASLIMQSDARWQWDDSNNTDLPIATTGLVANQQDYTLAVSHLDILRVEVQDTNGSWRKLIPIDQADIYGTSLTDFMKTAGAPYYYDKLGASVFLYPKPNYTQASSLKIWFQRGPSYFAVTDTSKSPGFNVLYHDLIPLWIAYNFALANGKENGSNLGAEIKSKEDALQEDYALRAKDDHNGIRARPQRWN